MDELKKKIKDDALKRLKAAQPKPVEPKIAKDTAKKASASTIAAKSKLPYDSSAPTLDKFVKLELLEQETPENIEKIWNAGHANKDCITAAIPSDVYNKLYEHGQKYPMVKKKRLRQQEKRLIALFYLSLLCLCPVKKVSNSSSFNLTLINATLLLC